MCSLELFIVHQLSLSVALELLNCIFQHEVTLLLLSQSQPLAVAKSLTLTGQLGRLCLHDLHEASHT